MSSITIEVDVDVLIDFAVKKFKAECERQPQVAADYVMCRKGAVAEIQVPSPFAYKHDLFTEKAAVERTEKQKAPYKKRKKRKYTHHQQMPRRHYVGIVKDFFKTHKVGEVREITAWAIHDGRYCTHQAVGHVMSRHMTPAGWLERVRVNRSILYSPTEELRVLDFDKVKWPR